MLVQIYVLKCYTKQGRYIEVKSTVKNTFNYLLFLIRKKNVYDICSANTIYSNVLWKFSDSSAAVFYHIFRLCCECRFNVKNFDLSPILLGFQSIILGFQPIISI
jgi:hypothetical protein